MAGTNTHTGPASSSTTSAAQKMIIDNCGLLSSQDDKCLGLDPEEALQLLDSEEGWQPLDIDVLTQTVEADINPHRVVIDCTASHEVADYYERWLSKGIHVICPSKTAGSGPLDRYKRIRSAMDEGSAQWHYESSIGAALPIVNTMRDLLLTGDTVYQVEGCLSGTMACVLRTLSETVPFSAAVREAVSQGYTEIDVRCDLSGQDSAEKLIMVARELGLDLTLDDVEIESLVPQHLANKEYPDLDRKDLSEAVVQDLCDALDGIMHERLMAAMVKDKVLRHVVLLDVATGKAQVAVREVGRDHPLYRLQSDENLMSFKTERYKLAPLVVKGAAAGAELAATGVFADLLRLARSFA